MCTNSAATSLPVTYVIPCCFVQDEGYTFDQAYGKLLGTILVCGVIPIIFSVLPYRVLRKVFPPIVTGVTIILIGAKLAGTGLQVRKCCSRAIASSFGCLLTCLCKNIRGSHAYKQVISTLSTANFVSYGTGLALYRTNKAAVHAATPDCARLCATTFTSCTWCCSIGAVVSFALRTMNTYRQCSATAAYQRLLAAV